MGFFTNGSQSNNGSSGATIIAAGTKVNGEVNISCNLHVDGELEGITRSSSVITIGKSGVVNGEVYAKKFIVSGRFTGVCDCDTVEILPNGRIDGKIISKELMIERKGYFIGESKIKNDKVSKKETQEEKVDREPTI